MGQQKGLYLWLTRLNFMVGQKTEGKNLPGSEMFTTLFCAIPNTFFL
jgi:hypothetical protein